MSSSPGPEVRRASDLVRQNNLSAILTRLHHRGAISRSSLSTELGLNRSTIAALVSELADLGLVYETARSEQRTVGRPGFDVHPNTVVAALVVNPDIDAVIIALVGLGGEVHKRIRFPTERPPTVKETINIVRVVVEGMSNELHTFFRIVGVGVSVPGLVEAGTGTVTMAPHLVWRDEPLAELMTEALGYPVMVANDADIGLLAENIYGVARGVENLIYLNGSASGIGGGVITGGTALRGSQGFGGELGHIRAHGDFSKACHCGRQGCLETEVRLDTLAALLDRADLDLDEFDRLVSATDDPAVRDEISRQLDLTAAVLVDLVSVFNPELVVLGGFLGSLHTAQPDRLTTALAASAFGTLRRPVRIERAQFRSRQLIMGAAEIAFAPVLTNPGLPLAFS
jgi:predicted NBD/HSP70 family sugar kinase